MPVAVAVAARRHRRSRMIYSARLISAMPAAPRVAPPARTPAVGEEGWPNVSTPKVGGYIRL